MIALPKSTAAHSRAIQYMPLGVADSYRYWGEGKTIFIKEGKGGAVTDIDGNRYWDFRLSYGPIILGYRDVRVDQSVIAAITDSGSMFGLSVEAEATLAERVTTMCPQIELLRYANSGTEAVMGAIRAARSYTRKSKIVVVEGGFHGLFDQMMWQTNLLSWDRTVDERPPLNAFGTGIPPILRQLIIAISLNDCDDAERVFREAGNDIAAVIIEPIMGNCGSIPATCKYIEALRLLCDQNGSLLIMDEIKTGFRVGKNGVQGEYQIYADISTYGKALGNGYAISIFGGRRDVMECITPSGMIHGGTYTANPVGLAAAIATLNVVDTTDALNTARAVGTSISSLLTSVLKRKGVPHCITGHPSMFGLHFVENPPTSFRDWTEAKNELYLRFARALLSNGILIEPDAREPWFTCEAHDALDFGAIEKAIGNSVDAALLG